MATLPSNITQKVGLHIIILTVYRCKDISNFFLPLKENNFTMSLYQGLNAQHVSEFRIP